MKNANEQKISNKTFLWKSQLRVFKLLFRAEFIICHYSIIITTFKHSITMFWTATEDISCKEKNENIRRQQQQFENFKSVC